MAKNDDNLLKELKRIRNLLVLIALKSGASSEEVNYATGMGAANIRAMFPVKRGKRKTPKSN
jgi:hypothetical protein